MKALGWVGSSVHFEFMNSGKQIYTQIFTEPNNIPHILYAHTKNNTCSRMHTKHKITHTLTHMSRKVVYKVMFGHTVFRDSE